MEMSHLRCFLAVAEELHFGKAAERLNMTQPPVSRQIQLLERDIGCELFKRHKRSVRLTHAGAAFVPKAQEILRLTAQASDTARSVATGERGRARCGFTATTAYHYLPILLEGLQNKLPEVQLELREMVSVDQIAALESRELEVALTRAPIDLSGFENRLIWQETLVAALPPAHALHDRNKITWHDMQGLPFVMYERQKGAYFHKLISSRLAIDGVFPTFVQHLSQTHSILSLVRAGVGMAVVPKSAAVLEFSDVEFREISDDRETLAELYVAWHSENQNPIVPVIADLAVSCGNVSIED